MASFLPIEPLVKEILTLKAQIDFGPALKALEGVSEASQPDTTPPDQGNPEGGLSDIQKKLRAKFNEADETLKKAAEDSKKKAEEFAKEQKEKAKAAVQDAKNLVNQQIDDLINGANTFKEELKQDIQDISSKAGSLVKQLVEFIKATAMLVPSSIGSCPMGPTVSPAIVIKGISDLFVMASNICATVDTCMSLLGKYETYAQKIPSVNSAFTTVKGVLQLAANAAKMAGAVCENMNSTEKEAEQKVPEMPELKASKCVKYINKYGQSVSKKQMNASNCSGYSCKFDESVTNGQVACKFCGNYSTERDDEE